MVPEPTAPGPDDNVEPPPTRMEFRIQAGQPIQWGQPPATRLPAASRFAPLGETLKAYREAAKSLLVTKYPALQAIAPPHLRGRCSCLAIACDDGLVLRWDEDPTPNVRIGTKGIDPSQDTVEFWAPVLSERFVWCPADPSTFTLPDDGQHIQLAKVGPGISPEVISNFSFGIVVDRSKAPTVANPAAGRPLPLASLLNEFEVLFYMEGFDADKEPTPGSGQLAIVRQRMRLAVGWSAIEIFPKFDADAWKPEQAAAAAEIDLLGIAVRHSLHENALNALDSRAATRREYWRLLDEFEGLLNGAEAPLQAFLADHPVLLSPTHVKAWPKVPLGSRVTDFIFREPTADYVLVELEAPTRQLFRKDGQQHQELTHAVNQVMDWYRYLEDNLATVQRELTLEGISTNPDALIVIGRSSALTEADRRKLTTGRNIHPKIKIRTYDDVLAAAEATVANLLGPRLIAGTGADVYYISSKEPTIPPAS